MENLPVINRFKIKDIVLTGLLTSMVLIFTIVVQIPTAKGYLNIGDIIVIFSGYLLGSRRGAIIGGIGSSLADLLSGHAEFFFITLIAKGGEGLISGFIGKNLNPQNKFLPRLIGGLLAGLWMVLFYFAGQWIYFGLVSLTTIPTNILQASLGITGALALYRAIGRKLS